MKRTGIIGMGNISCHYFEGLKNSKILKLVACCDKNEYFASKDLYKNYPYYSNHIDMLKSECLDCVIISTPPATHYELIKDCLNAGVNVLIEKPCVLEMALLIQLIELAKAKQLELQVMYHWQNGEEVRELLSEYDKSKIKGIKVRVYDPYSSDGKTINPEKVGLEGAWIDSGVNALSYVKCFLEMDAFQIKKVNIKRCEKTGLPIFVDASLDVDGMDVQILVDWTKGKNLKESEFVYDKRKIYVSNSEQTIYDGERIIKCDDMIRLTRHYYNLFTKRVEQGEQLGDTIKIHEILLQVRDMYEALIG